jgi:hypothetical protein
VLTFGLDTPHPAQVPGSAAMTGLSAPVP